MKSSGISNEIISKIPSCKIWEINKPQRRYTASGVYIIQLRSPATDVEVTHTGKGRSKPSKGRWRVIEMLQRVAG